MENFTPIVPWSGWELVHILGHGSFGAVYEIQRTLFDETERAAMKVIRIPKSRSEIEDLYGIGYDDESITVYFEGHLKNIVAEYSLMRKMNGSANVVNCDDVHYVQHSDAKGWDIYIKMELLTPLANALPEMITEDQVLKIAKDICKALVLCKKHNIIHRDIKPQNIFVSDNGDYKLGDFGIAKTIEQTSGGTLTGTYRYMAPEVYKSQPYGTAADIYSLGIVLYWLLNERRLPFIPLPPEKITASLDSSAQSRRLNGEAIPAPAHGSNALKSIVLKACAYEPSNRYASAQDMLDALNNLDKQTEEVFTDSLDEDGTIIIEKKKESKSESEQQKPTNDSKGEYHIKFKSTLNPEEKSEQERYDELIRLADDAAGAGDYNKAIEHLTEALSIDKNTDVYFYLGNMYNKLNQAEKARDAFKSALLVSPNHILSLANLGLLLLEQNDNEQALQYLKSAYDQMPTDHPVRGINTANLAVAVARVGNKKEGLRLLEEARKLDFEDYAKYKALIDAINDGEADTKKDRKKRKIIPMCIAGLLILCAMFFYLFEFVGITVSRGSSGDTTWRLESTGKLIISGSGSTHDYLLLNDKSPWYQNSDIKELVVEEGVTGIGANTFFGCDSLRTVSLPKSLEQIGVNAFFKCDAIAEINYPGKLSDWEKIYISPANTYFISNLYDPDAESSPFVSELSAKKIYSAAMRYRHGDGVAVNMEICMNLLKKASALGSSEALSTLAYIYNSGDSWVRAPLQVLELLETAIERNDYIAVANMGFLPNGNKNGYSIALEEYIEGADSDNAAALVVIGYCYRYGLGTDIDLAKAAEYFEKAADLDNTTALNYLGGLYYYGIGVEKDYEKALQLRERAIELGHSSVLCNIGFMYENGEAGCPQDYEKAFEYYKKAADLGSAAGYVNMALKYSEGRGVEKNYSSALQMYKKAADMGLAAAMYNLGNLYVEESPHDALKCFTDAADLGYVNGMIMAAKLYYEQGTIPPANSYLEKAQRSLSDEVYANYLAKNTWISELINS